MMMIDDDEIDNVVCNKNKRYKEGKHTLMSNCNYLGQEHKGRKGIQKATKLLKTWTSICFTKSCCNFCLEKVHKLIF